MLRPIYVTGGIASGKSTCTEYLCQMLPRAYTFDADQSVHEILTKPEIIANVCTLFGDHVLGPDGQLDRPTLRSRVFAEPALREQLEQLLHPEVYADLERQIRAASHKAPKGHFIAEIPLYYETTHSNESTSADSPVPKGRLPGLEVVVACSDTLQRKRLASRGWSEEDANRAISSQLPLLLKVAQSDRVIWTSVPLQSTQRQLRLLVALLSKNRPPEL